MNRIVIATGLGLAAGFICMLGGMSLGIVMTPAVIGWILLNRVMLGFVIGISTLRVHWAWHGVVISLTVGSLFPYSAYLFGRRPLVVWGTLVASVIFGVVIEFFTTIVFNRPRELADITGKSKAAAA